jgi:murein DD-endopeptidase MepM/ murein hydrolase activator NlpD
MRSSLKQLAWISLLLIITITWPVGVVLAQEEQPQGPIYIVQEGDTLWDIALRFGIPWQDLARENEISDGSQLKAGDELIIPGLEGVQGALVTEEVPLGETLRSLSRRFQIPIESLIRLNHVTSPTELYQGANLIVPLSEATSQAAERISLTTGQSLMELAVVNGTNPWSLATLNGMDSTWQAVPGDVLHYPGDASTDGPGGLPGDIQSLTLDPSNLVQGDTGLIRLESDGELDINGSFLGQDLNFFKDQNGDYIALQGVHAMKKPGIYPLTIRGMLEDGTPLGFSQMVPVSSGDFNYYELTVPPETVDPANTKPEDELWTSLTNKITEEKYWDDVFGSPVSLPSPCGYTSFFGERRSYNGSAFNYFHTGLDFCYNYNIEVNEIYAPAAGRVVFAEPLTVRGNATMIDHGWGVFTGYMHQEEILVKEGDWVEKGQVIGKVGETGRVNGPHLHFEVWVNGVQVDPLDWLERAYP